MGSPVRKSTHTVSTLTYSIDRGDAYRMKAVRDGQHYARVEMSKWDSIGGTRPTFDINLSRPEAEDLRALLVVLLDEWRNE